NQHYMPAFKKGIAEKRKEIKAIAKNKAAPTFENTIVALEKTGKALDKVSNVFYNLTSSNTNKKLQAINQKVTPLLTALGDEINMNSAIFGRIKSVHKNQKSMNLNHEQINLLEKYYKGFVRGGANLTNTKKVKLKKINSELASLTLKFGDNVLAGTNKFKLVIDKEKDLAGLPDAVIINAADAAKAAGLDGKWVITAQKPSFLPFLQYSEVRSLREKALKGYNNLGNNNDKFDNKKIASRIAALRVKKANILGYKTHADFVLEMNMAKNPATVNELLMKLWKPALRNAKKEAAEIQAMIDADGGGFKLAAWDWWFYSDKIKKAKYDLDDELLKPYFKLENVRDGAFALANKLWGITFTKRNDIPLYHPEVETFEVKEADGKHIGILTTDYFPRASKRGGAWMNPFRKQSRIGGVDVTPVICNVCNFSKPVGDIPSLLTFEEVTTLFHEFGHALHGLLSNCTYPSTSGTDVPRDFVELPSQIMENWCGEPEMLKIYAKHYLTGEVIPEELIQKLQKASKFNQGFVTTEFLSAALLDMKWHSLTTSDAKNTDAFEKEALDEIGLIDEIVVRYKSTYFRHIFAGGYSSGYYSYIWSGVLDADAFQAFKETSLFDQKTAKLYRDNILSRGGTEDPMELYKRFRGREPKIDALIKRRGLDG
ncbi:MAG: M3 family metallopeptidase, partial [Chlorobi bacterium]|nr:M3 family metallopeptidase [Chlorobiota bacterium]